MRLSTLVAASLAGLAGIFFIQPRPIPMAKAAEGIEACDPGITLSDEERNTLFTKLRISKAGTQLIRDFESKYKNLNHLLLQWDAVSYSQVAHNGTGRSPASTEDSICVHLARRLPTIEHVADLAHEMVHATRLSAEVLRGDVATAAEFVHARIAARGGEADAFSVECVVKREIIGAWDSFCAPYVSHSESSSIDKDHVVDDLYNGQLAASLTGESYPVMLTHQFEAINVKRAPAGSVKALTLPKHTTPPLKQSALENKGRLQ